MPLEFTGPESSSPESFVVEVSSELSEWTVRRRWREVNTLVRLAMITGLQIHLDATIQLLCDFAGEMVKSEIAAAYLWDEPSDQVQLRALRGIEGPAPGNVVSGGSVLHLWATRYGRPMILSRGRTPEADLLLSGIEATSAMVVPLLANNRVVGSLQFFLRGEKGFDIEDAQLLWVLSLISEHLLARGHANEGLIRFAFTDYLTGLSTRGYFEQQLDLEIKRYERKRQQFALLMIDIDHFKPVNDTFGHHVGDLILREVAAILMKDMREVDTAARYGGEEFVIILPETSERGAAFVAERIRKTVEQARYPSVPEELTNVTVSIGSAIFGQDAHFKRDLIEFADAALYAAKSRGRNQVALYSELALQTRKKEVS